MSDKVAIITSDRGVSLKKVALDIGMVIEKAGVAKVKYIMKPDLDPFLYKDVSHAIVVMPFDSVHVIPYFFLARELKVNGKKVFFYTTIEGKIKIAPSDRWIIRDLEYIANSEYTRDKLEEAGVVVTDLVYHGVNIDFIDSFKWRRDKTREFLGVKPDDFLVGYIAGGYSRKGHDVFAQVAKAIQEKDKNIKIVVLTDDKGASNYTSVDNVILVTDFGKLPNDIVAGIYHAIDLYVQPSLSEGFGLPVLEALAAGKLVVHPDYKPLSEITTPDTSIRVSVTGVDYKDEGGGILFELHYYNPEEFADAVIHAKDLVLRNRDEISAKCIERAKEFDIHKVYKFFIDKIELEGVDNE